MNWHPNSDTDWCMGLKITATCSIQYLPYTLMILLKKSSIKSPFNNNEENTFIFWAPELSLNSVFIHSLLIFSYYNSDDYPLGKRNDYQIL